MLLLIFLSTITTTAQTGNWTDEGNYDISWYEDSKTEFSISTPQQLAGLAWLINNNQMTYKDCIFKLAQSISLEGHYWIPVKTFKHKLDGDGYSISNMNIYVGTSTSNQNIGLVSVLQGNISNLTIESNSSIIVNRQNYEGRIGGFAGSTSSGSSLQNCNFKGTIKAYGTGTGTSCKTYIGGIFGSGYAVAENCTNSGEITGIFYGTKRYLNADCCGGIAGMAFTTLRNCTNNGTVSGTAMTVANFGGIAGYSGGSYLNALVTDCTNNGKVSTENKGEESYSEIATGGIAGISNNNSIISNCTNNGTVESINNSTKAYLPSAEAGGIVGSNYNISINCINTGNVSTHSLSNSTAGGIASTNYHQLINCYNTGNINASSEKSNAIAGGIVASSFQSSETEKAFIYNCYNAGEITGTPSTSYIGGIAGRIHHSSLTSVKSRVRSCYNAEETGKSIGNDEDNQGEYITQLPSKEMQAADFANILNSNIKAYNDTTRQSANASLWEHNTSVNNAFPYLQIPVLNYRTNGYFSVIFSLKSNMPLTATASVRYKKATDTEEKSIKITTDSPKSIKVVPGISYQYQLALEDGNLQTRQIAQTFTIPSLIESCYAINIKRKSATLEAILKEESEDIQKAEFILSIEGDEKKTTYDAVISGSKVTANVSGLQPAQMYIAQVKLSTTAGDYYGNIFPIKTQNTGRYIAEVTQMNITQTTIRFEALVDENTKEPEGVLKECGVYYINKDSINTSNNNWDNLNVWEKAKGTSINQDQSELQRFDIYIDELNTNTAYYIRPYIIVNMPDDGDIEEVLSLPDYTSYIQTLPVIVTTLPTEDITQTTAKLSCTIDAGDANVIEKGFYLESKQIKLNDNEFSITATGLIPNRNYFYYAYAILPDGTILSGDLQSFKTNNISVNTVADNILQTSALIRTVYDLGDAISDKQGIEWAVNDEILSIEGENEYRITELPANSTISCRSYIAIGKSIYYSEWQEFTTKEISTAFEAADAISNTSATLHATVECDTHSSAQFGFEWRKYDAPDMVPSNTVIAEQLEKGKLTFALRGLSPSTYYKYRSFVNYQGQDYFSEWTAFGTADDFVLWAPTVKTLEVISVDGTTAVLAGYIIQGSEEIIQKGFEYWPKSQPSDRKYVAATENSMNSEIAKLKPLTSYIYRAFAKTASGTTYGQEMEFTTGAESGIGSEAAESFNVQLIQNPVHEVILLEIEGVFDGTVRYDIYTTQGTNVINGRSLANTGSNIIQINTCQFPKGLYLLQVSYGKQTRILKVMKK